MKTVLEWWAKVPTVFRGMIFGALVCIALFVGYKLFFSKEDPYIKTVQKDDFIKIDKNEKETMKLPKSEELDNTLDKILKEIE